MKPAFTPLQNKRDHDFSGELAETGNMVPVNSGRTHFVTGFTVETSKIVGTPAEGVWSQVHTFFPKEIEKKEKRGDLLAVLVVFGAEEGIEAIALGREILGRLHEEYYGDLEGSVFERLSKAVLKVSQENEGLEIVAASLFGQALYLSIYGQGKAILKRGEKMGVILQGSEKTLMTGSGVLQTGDLILLGSGHFFRVVSAGVMKAALQNNLLEEAVETLAPVVLGHSKMADAAVILALIKKEEEPLLQAVGPQEIEPEIKQGTKSDNFFVRIVRKIKLPQRESFFIRRTESEKKKRTFFIVAIVFLVLLGISLGFGVRKKMSEKKQAEVKKLIGLVEDKYNQGKVAYLTKPAEGKAFISEAIRMVDNGLLLNKNNQELSLLKDQMEKFLLSTGIDISLSEMPTFMDLGLITDGGNGISFSLLKKDLVILDQNQKKIYLLSIEKKSHEIIDYPTPEGMAIISEGNIFVFDGKGIFEINPRSKSAALKINEDEDWKEIVGFGSFGGNLYLLDRGSLAIWRYAVSGDGFEAKKNWFVSPPSDLSSAVSMAIDGSIWILDKDKILKFTLGEQENFTLTKMPENFANPVKIYTSSDSQNLYVLDRGRSKIYVIDKSGEFKASYIWEGIKQTTDLVVVESLKKIFLLSGAKIYEVGIK